jgi:hypothetical protein
MTRYIDTADAAKMLRLVLKATFPDVKFSVRISRHAGGSSIYVGWTDGPTTATVDKVVNGFKGKRFDAQDDLSYGADSWYCAKHGARPAETWGTGDDRSGPCESRCCAAAELVHFGSGHVSTCRTLSPEFRSEIEDAVAKQAGRAYDPEYHDGYEWMSSYVHRMAAETAR